MSPDRRAAVLALPLSEITAADVRRFLDREGWSSTPDGLYLHKPTYNHIGAEKFAGPDAGLLAVAEIYEGLSVAEIWGKILSLKSR